MQYIKIWDFNEESLMETLDKLSKVDKNEQVTIIIHSEWWEVWVEEILSEELKQYKLRIIVSNVISCWLTLLDKLYKYADSVKILNISQGMAHKTSVWIKINIDWHSSWYYQDFMYSMIKKIKDDIPSVLKWDKLKEYKKWNDVRLDSEDLQFYKK